MAYRTTFVDSAMVMFSTSPLIQSKFLTRLIHMKYIFIVLFSLCVSLSAQASLELSPAEAALMQEYLDKFSERNNLPKHNQNPVGVTQPVTPPTEESKWGDQIATIAEGFGNGIAAAASGVGVAVSDFVKTPAGILVVVGISLKLFGPMIFSFIFSILVIWFVIVFAKKLITTFMGIKSIEEGTTKTYLWGLFTKKERIQRYNSLSGCSDGTSFFVFLVMAGFFIITLVTILNF